MSLTISIGKTNWEINWYVIVPTSGPYSWEWYFAFPKFKWFFGFVPKALYLFVDSQLPLEFTLVAVAYSNGSFEFTKKQP